MSGAAPVRRRLALAAAVALLAALPYLAAGVSGSFVAYDDDLYIYDNPQVRRGLTPRTALWALTSTEQANWYPLRRLSHLVDASLFGMDARGHHLVSLGWHAAAAALLFLALRLMTGESWRSFAAAALFAAHPLQAESVAWAAERSNVQAGLFFALALLLWARYARRPGAGRYAAALVAGALGLMAKPVLATLPFVLLLLDVWPLGRLRPPGAPAGSGRALPPGRLLLEKAPLLLLGAASVAVGLYAHRQYGALSSLAELPPGYRLANAALSYARYLDKLLWPRDLAAFYPHPGEGIPLAAALGSALFLAVITAAALLRLRRRPYLAAGWLWYAGMLLPASGVVQFGAHAMADRFAYLPSVGIFLAAVWLAAELLPTGRVRAAVAGPLAVAALAALAAATAAQAGYWRDSETLFEHAIAATRDNWLMQGNLGTVLAGAGRHAEAVAAFEESLRLQPAQFKVRTNLAISLAALGRQREAVESFREAVRLAPGDASAHMNLGISLAALGRREEAAAALRETVRLAPGYPEAWYNLGMVLSRLGRHREAAASLEEALRLRAGSPAFGPGEVRPR